jgi:DNA-binding beta-propeller fold protein YncE
VVTRPTGRVLARIGQWRTAESVPLDWPRYAIDTGNGYAVADGRNGRIVFTGPGGEFRRSLSAWRRADEPRPHPFQDPHHLHPVRRGATTELIVTDSAAGRVVHLGLDGVAVCVRAGLSDPHMSVPDPTGGLLVCDTGNHRVVRLLPGGGECTVLDAESVRRDTGQPLSSPRSMAVLAGGSMVVVDTGNHRLVHWSPAKGAVSLEPATKQLMGSLYFPRHVSVDHRTGLMLVTDFDNSRIVFAPLARVLGVACGQ